ncbi:MAG: signal peptidase II [Woeseiaceae bacterium]
MTEITLHGRNARWLLVTALVVIVDQASKFAIIEQMTLYQRIPLLPVLDVVRLHNTGAAFSFLANQSGWQNWLFSGVAVVVSIAIVWWLLTLPRTGRAVLALGLSLILGGAIGNFIDRALYGYVVDFILFHYEAWSYPAFNMADSAITVGVALMLYDGLILERRRAREGA